MSTLSKVRRMLQLTFGDEYGDGKTVTDVIVGYAEPGYGSCLGDEAPVIVLGNWNPKRFCHEGEPPLTPAESLPARLAESLERLGAEIEWLDEWDSCGECSRAIRTEPDSYSWKRSYLETDNGRVCHDCAIEAGEDMLTDYVNDPYRMVTWCEANHVEQYGYVKWEPGEPRTFENGWHPGQDTDPSKILDEITGKYPDVEVIFFLDESSQFYVTFSAYVRDIHATE